MDSYPPPVNKLLALGDIREELKQPDYLALGLRPEHVPDLIRMATDKELLWADSEDDEVWAPIHAWRALGQLRAVEAIEPLMGLFEPLLEEGDDWIFEEMPAAFGNIGPAAIPALKSYLADTARDESARVCALVCLEEIVKKHPEARDECVAIFMHQLEQLEQDAGYLNGSLVSALLDLKAVEAAPVMELAFKANCVDEWIAGDWDDVQVELGLKERSEIPPQLELEPEPEPFPLMPPFFERPAPYSGHASQKKKARRQQEKKSRKINSKRR
ncbi:MAG TPA: DUF1186 domain-containing protein [Chthonomonadaceae bacterium]|nr:DUF1186 domain-containing protein [Chthonomonadaceae bacterium]